MKLVDAGVVLRYLLNVDEPESLQAREVFRHAAVHGEKLILLHCVVFEVIYVLEKYYQAPRRKVVDIILKLLDTVNVYTPKKRRLVNALSLYVENDFDLVDCYLCAEIQSSSIDGIYSFDEEFAAMGVRRFHPADVEKESAN